MRRTELLVLEQLLYLFLRPDLVRLRVDLIAAEDRDQIFVFPGLDVIVSLSCNQLVLGAENV